MNTFVGDGVIVIEEVARPPVPDDAVEMTVVGPMGAVVVVVVGVVHDVELVEETLAMMISELEDFEAAEDVCREDRVNIVNGG